MAKKISRNRIIKQKRSKNIRSIKSYLVGGGDSVGLLYVNNRVDPDEYELILVADNLKDLLLQAKDVPENMMESNFQDEVIDNMYIQPTFINSNTDMKYLRKINPKAIIHAKGNIISSTDESTLYYTCDSSGLVTSIYNNRDEIERLFPESDIKSIKKNNFDWYHPLFTQVN